MERNRIIAGGDREPERALNRRQAVDEATAPRIARSRNLRGESSGDGLAVVEVVGHAAGGGQNFVFRHGDNQTERLAPGDFLTVSGRQHEAQMRLLGPLGRAEGSKEPVHRDAAQAGRRDQENQGQQDRQRGRDHRLADRSRVDHLAKVDRFDLRHGASNGLFPERSRAVVVFRLGLSRQLEKLNGRREPVVQTGPSLFDAESDVQVAELHDQRRDDEPGDQPARQSENRQEQAEAHLTREVEEPVEQARHKNSQNESRDHPAHPVQGQQAAHLTS